MYRTQVQSPIRIDMNQSQTGYTLSEVMIVLVAFSAILAVVVPFHHQVVATVKVTHYLEQIENDLLLAQQLTMQHHPHYWVMIRPDQRDYYLYDYANRKILLHRKFPKEWAIRLPTLEIPIQFNASGSIQNPGTMVLLTPKANYKLTFPFGKSRVTIHEQ
ncbi:prepilin-type N-terminal cleavage/methylation domain-containing protein [Halobacillus naozhouensis]|uniref:Prepilin-type N-terminal cleavage/methylation domain-containing protein n=1 Tax=Halobacillus naozhouensis TaxID=554880 RepID=A0ABY8ITB7_9BACI|nr:prepilin-type N-terminal cleavage/methylation domain-containing protein [Halobacillus naozhouensis]WFT73247.1 prepilin-type N-terminal cleavage/methylation domain-containing protein [Halobacillus naozhouensis]